jgi:hypothetical protein
LSGLQELCSSIYNDLRERFPNQRDTQRRKLSELSSAVLLCQSPNLMEISNVLDRPTDCEDARYNYVERFLKNPLVKPDEVMSFFAKDLLSRLSKHQSSLVLMIDQTKINDRLELLMVSIRMQKRALPILWCAKETKGNIGFEHQKALLDVISSWIPKDVGVMLSGDRFYGSAALIQWCQTHEWQYRLRLKGNFKVYQRQGPEKNLETLHKEGVKAIEGARFVMGVTTSVGMLHEKGHKEPWFIAMDCKPTKYRTLDYGMRWGIENMFADFKSRGFCLTQTQIRLADRLERLLLVISIAFHWAVSVGLAVKKKETLRPKGWTVKKEKDHVFHFLNAAFANSKNISQWTKNHHLYGFIQTDGC